MINGGFYAVPTYSKGVLQGIPGNTSRELPQTERATTKINKLSTSGQRMKETNG